MAYGLKHRHVHACHGAERVFAEGVLYRVNKQAAGLAEGFAHEAEVRADVRKSAHAVDGEAVRRAVAQLSPGLRDVVELGVFQSLPYADVGEILGIPVGTVKSRMFNALRKLKEILS